MNNLLVRETVLFAMIRACLAGLRLQLGSSGGATSPVKQELFWKTYGKTAPLSGLKYIEKMKFS